MTDPQPKYPFQPGTIRRVPGLGWIIDDAVTKIPMPPKKQPCPVCAGSGCQGDSWDDGDGNERCTECPTCDGTGMRRRGND